MNSFPVPKLSTLASHRIVRHLHSLTIDNISHVQEIADYFDYVPTDLADHLMDAFHYFTRNASLTNPFVADRFVAALMQLKLLANHYVYPHRTFLLDNDAIGAIISLVTADEKKLLFGVKAVEL